MLLFNELSGKTDAMMMCTYMRGANISVILAVR